MENPPPEPGAAAFGFEPPSSPILPAAPKQPGPRLGSALIVSAIYYIAVFAVIIPVGVYMHFKQRPLDSMTLTLISQLVGWPLAMLAGVLISRRSWGDSFAIRRCPARILPGVIIGCFGLSFVLNRLATTIPMPDFFEAMFRDLMKGNPVMVFVCMAVLAPLTEELFFRGWMLRGFAAHYSRGKAVWLTAIIFALFHLNPWQAMVALPLGVIFAHWALQTGSLLPGLVGHFMVNFTGSQLMLPISGLFGYSAETMEKLDHLPWEIVGLGTLLAVIGLSWVARELRVHAVPGAPEALT